MSDLPVPVEKSSAIPVLPLRDVVVYPHMVIPLFVGREKSILALEAAMKGDKRIMLVAQRHRHEGRQAHHAGGAAPGRGR